MEEKYEKIKPKKINHIDAFLDKFKKAIGFSGLEKEIVLDLIKKEFGISLEKEDVRIFKKIIYLNISPVFKNEILIRKDKILKSLKEKNISVLDIK